MIETENMKTMHHPRSQNCPPSKIMVMASLASSILFIETRFVVTFMNQDHEVKLNLLSSLKIYLPFGPNERPFKIPSLGILIKFMGHRMTHRIRKPKMPKNIKSEVKQGR